MITGEPSQMLDISNDLLDYLRAAHINDADDAQEFEDTMEDVKELLQAVSDTINEGIPYQLISNPQYLYWLIRILGFYEVEDSFW